MEQEDFEKFVETYGENIQHNYSGLKERTVSDEKRDQGMTFFGSAIVLILILIFFRKGILKKIVMGLCLYGMFSSSIAYLAVLVNSRIPSLIICLIAALFIYKYIKKRRRVRRNER